MSPFSASLPYDLTDGVGICPDFSLPVGVSADARYVAYRASPQLEGATEGLCWLYVFDRETSVVHPVHALGDSHSVSPDGTVYVLEAISQDGQTIYQILRNETDIHAPGTLRAHRWVDGTDTFTDLGIAVSWAAVAADGSMLVVQGALPDAPHVEWRVYDLAGGGHTLLPITMDDHPTNAIVSPTGDWFACHGTVSEDGEWRFLRWIVGLRTGVVEMVPAPLELPRDFEDELAFVGDDLLMMTAPDGVRVVRDLRTGVMTPHPLPAAYGWLVPALDGATALVVDRGRPDRGRPPGALWSRVWRAEDGVGWATYSVSSDLFGLETEETVYFSGGFVETISPDGQWVVFRGRGYTDGGWQGHDEYFLLPTRW